jgi:hypothetical protein
MARGKHTVLVPITSLSVVSEAQLPSRKSDATISGYHIKLMALSPGVMLLHIDGDLCRPVRFSDLFFEGLHRPFILHLDQSIAPENECLGRQLSACLNKCRRIDHCDDGHYSVCQPDSTSYRADPDSGSSRPRQSETSCQLYDVDSGLRSVDRRRARGVGVSCDRRRLSAEPRPDLLKWRLAGRRISCLTE